MKKIPVSFYTLGCRVNQSETASIQNSFEANGYKVMDFGKPVDIVVVNTCTVTENGDTDTRRIVNKINRHNPGARIALIGCQAQVQKGRLTGLPNVKWVVGNGKKMDLVSVLNEIKDTDTPQVITPAIPRGRFTVPFAGIDRSHTRANIKIQDGCDFFCAFCEVPYARGRARSRQFDDILREAKILVAAGHRELVVTGINVGTYADNNKNITDVIKALDDLEGLKRIRISSIEPTTIPDELLNMCQTKLCRHLHIPVQSGDDAVLKLMKRQYSARMFRDFIQKAQDTIPGICIGTDIVVGFPGETEASFDITHDFLREAPVHYFHVFSYSRRNMAKSKNLPNKVPRETIEKRSRVLRELGRQKRRLYHESLQGTVGKVLFEEKKGHYWTGLTDNYVRVKIKSNECLTNRFTTVKLMQVEEDGVIAEKEP